MSLDRLLEEATSPADAAEAAQLMAAATVDDSDATEQQRNDAREILDLSWEELLARFTPHSPADAPAAPSATTLPLPDLAGVPLVTTTAFVDPTLGLADPQFTSVGKGLIAKLSGMSPGTQLGGEERSGPARPAIFVSRKFSDSEIRQVEASLPDGVELVFIDEVPLRSNGSDRS